MLVSRGRDAAAAGHQEEAVSKALPMAWEILSGQKAQQGMFVRYIYIYINIYIPTRVLRSMLLQE